MASPKITPVRRQYLDIKQQYPNAIIFFRLGDFYETFDDDAETVSSVLDIVLTSRNVGKGTRVPMAGIPYHAIENYLSRLIEKGFHKLGKLAKNHIPKEIHNKNHSWEKKMIVYADSRVLNDKIVSQDYRIKDALKRYDFPEEEKIIEVEFGKKCEKDIFSVLDIMPDDLTKLND